MFSKPDNQIKSQYYLKNREKCLIYMHKYQAENREKLREYNRLYYEKNKERLRIIHNIYARARYYRIGKPKPKQTVDNQPEVQVPVSNDVDEIILPVL